MSGTLRWTSADLEALPDDGKRYEIIDGELYVSKQPHYQHQYTCTALIFQLASWAIKNRNGRVLGAPGVIFAEDDDVAPDVIWISNERLATALRADGKFHEAPELMIEVLSPGSANVRRDREAKLKLYSRRGVAEYWIVDWLTKRIEIYRRNQDALELRETFAAEQTLETSLLPGFSCPIVTLFDELPG